jgi:nitrate reductase NapE component
MFSKLDSERKSDSKDKSGDAEKPARRDDLSRRHSDNFHKSFVEKEKENPRDKFKRRSSMAESKADLARIQSTLKRTPSLGSLKRSIKSTNSKVSDDNSYTIKAFSTFKKSSDTNTKDMKEPSKKEPPSAINSRSSMDMKEPPKKTPSKFTSRRATVDVRPSKLSPKEKESSYKKEEEYKAEETKTTTKDSVETAAPVMAVVPEKQKGIRISRFTMFAVCVLYIVSLLLVGVLGFWLHMVLFATQDQDGGASTPMLNWTMFNTSNWFGEEEDDDDAKQKDEMAIVPNVDEGSKVTLELKVDDSPSSSPMSIGPTVSMAPSSSTRAPTAVPNTLVADSKNTPPTSTTPTFTMKPSTNIPSAEPSYSPSSAAPTYQASAIPSLEPSFAPSASPTGIPKCPDELLKIAPLGENSPITMRYEVIPLPLSDPHGGLFCVSIEYVGNAGWIGFAVSGASRDPSFGRKEAIIGLPGVTTSVAVASPEADVAVGQQVGTELADGPMLINPGKYEIPAGKHKYKLLQTNSFDS